MNHHDTPHHPLTDDTTTDRNHAHRVTIELGDNSITPHAAALRLRVAAERGTLDAPARALVLFLARQLVLATCEICEPEPVPPSHCRACGRRVDDPTPTLQAIGRRFRLGGTTTADATASAERVIRRLRDEVRHTSLEPLPVPPTREELLDQEQRRRLRDPEPGRHRANRPEPPLRDSYRGRHAVRTTGADQ